MRTWLLIALLSSVIADGGAAAQEDNFTRARAHFTLGQTYFKTLHDYRAALREFRAGFELAPRPEFLLNMGQCHRKLGQTKEALAMYEQYLAATPPSGDPVRRDAERVRDELRQELRDAPPPVAAPAPSAPSTLAPSTLAPSTLAPPALAPAPSARSDAARLTAPAPPRGSFARRHWWIFPVAAVAVGAALGLGLYFGLSHSCPGDAICPPVQP